MSFARDYQDDAGATSGQRSRSRESEPRPATFLDTTILYVAFPDLTNSFGSTPASELSWPLNGFTIVFAALLIPAGKLADRIGHRKVFVAESGILTAASAGHLRVGTRIRPRATRDRHERSW